MGLGAESGIMGELVNITTSLLRQCGSMFLKEALNNFCYVPLVAPTIFFSMV